MNVLYTDERATPPDRAIGSDTMTTLLNDRIETGDVLVVTQKIVSKAEGRVVDLSTVTPSEEALELSRINGRDARQIEVALRETANVIRKERGILISETRHGFICATAIPSHVTEATMLAAPMRTNNGGAPKKTSARIPTGINMPARASHDTHLRVPL